VYAVDVAKNMVNYIEKTTREENMLTGPYVTHRPKSQGRGT